MQTEAAECALACVAMISCFHGHDLDLASLRRRFSTSLKGSTLSRVVEIAYELGFDAHPLRTELEYLSNAKLPCILHWSFNHFVVLNKVARSGLEIYDPARGRYRLSWSEASKRFTGIVLELTPSSTFEPIVETRQVSLRSLSGKFIGIGRVILQLTSLAFAIEMLSLVMPFQTQLLLDEVIISRDRNLLLVLAMAFLALAGITGLLGLARAWIISWVGASLNAQWITNLFNHLLKLPLDYFEKRHMGDILSRFGSVQSIQNTITGSFVETVLDGSMGSLTLIILCVYSLPLTSVVLVSFAAYTALRLIMLRALWRINEEQLIYGARQQSELMESVRGVQAIKLANKQGQRRARLATATLEAANRTMRGQRIALAFGVINQLIFGSQRVLLVSFGAYLVIQSRFSAGMLVAYLSYAGQLSTRFGALVDHLIDFRLLKLHAERISDITLTPPEKNSKGIYSGPTPRPRIQIKNLCFRYAEGEPWVLRNIDITIEDGESVAITGHSGCGKSTLVKLLVGLLEPTEGAIEIGGVDVRNYGLDNYRSLIGAVMQDDTLFAGTIAQNIALFDSAFEIDDVVLAATMAGIHDEIIRMPMAYDSTVGDMGSALSGGQKQRLLFARALYKKPSLLVLDEATSHLDAGNEHLISERVKVLGLTRIIVAHRSETISSAERVIDLSRINASIGTADLRGCHATGAATALQQVKENRNGNEGSAEG